MSSSFGFADVDRSADPHSFVRFLDAASAQDPIRAYKARLLDLAAVRPGERWLDVGCGTGEDACRLAERVGPSGHVTGIDTSETMLVEARKRTAPLGLPVAFRTGNVVRLDVPGGHFDGCRVDRVLHVLADPHAALCELERVTRSGGRVVLAEPDFSTLSLPDPESTPTRLLLDRVGAGRGHAEIGSELAERCARAGLTDIRAEVFRGNLTDFDAAARLLRLGAALKLFVFLGLVSPDEVHAWWARQRTASDEGRFACSLDGCIVLARVC